MARLWAKVSRSKVSSIPKNTFSVEIYWRNQPQTSFLSLIGFMLRSGAKLTGRIRFSKNHVFSMNFCTKSHLTYFLGLMNYMARLGAKVSWSEVSSILKNPFSIGIFWWNRPHTSFLGPIGSLVRSGAKLFRTKNLLNFAAKALSNSFFQKTHFRFEFLY